MLKTEVLYSVDSCLRNYVLTNETSLQGKYRTYLMDRGQLSAFYGGMIDNLSDKKIGHGPKIGNKQNPHKHNRSVSSANRGYKYCEWKNQDKAHMKKQAVLFYTSAAKNQQKRDARPCLARENRNRRKSCEFRGPAKQKITSSKIQEESQKDWISSSTVQKYIGEHYHQYCHSGLKQLCDNTRNIKPREDQYEEEQLQQFKAEEENKYLMRKKIKIADISEQSEHEGTHEKVRQASNFTEKKRQNRSPAQSSPLHSIKTTPAGSENQPLDSRALLSKKAQLDQKLRSYLLKKNRYMPYF